MSEEKDNLKQFKEVIIVVMAFLYYFALITLGALGLLVSGLLFIFHLGWATASSSTNWIPTIEIALILSIFVISSRLLLSISGYNFDKVEGKE